MKTWIKVLVSGCVLWQLGGINRRRFDFWFLIHLLGSMQWAITLALTVQLKNYYVSYSVGHHKCRELFGSMPWTIFTLINGLQTEVHITVQFINILFATIIAEHNETIILRVVVHFWARYMCMSRLGMHYNFSCILPPPLGMQSQLHPLQNGVSSSYTDAVFKLGAHEDSEIWTSLSQSFYRRRLTTAFRLVEFV